MSRKITNLVTAALIAGHNFKGFRDNVCNMSDELLPRAFSHLPPGNYSVMSLHGNPIAARNMDTGELWITNAGWQSNTTKERLNGLPGVSIYQKNFEWYLNGEKWNGQTICVNTKQADNV